jgi:prepilin signal peptidase PulO-like enzyme (type II secretory pathway)
VELIFQVTFFIFGAIVASFMGVVVDRLNTGTSIVRGRSKCDACGRDLSVLSLIPFFSYAFSKGRARCCGVHISWVSSVIEIILGILFVAAYQMLGLTWTLPFLLIALATLLGLVLYDLRHTILPPELLSVFIVAAIGVAATTTPDFHTLSISFGVALLFGGFLALLHFGSGGRAMGFADAPLAFGLSLLAGPAALSGFIFSFWIGAGIGITLLVRAPKGARMGIEVPFAPFLAAGFLLAYFTSWNPFTLISELMMRLLGG